MERAGLGATLANLELREALRRQRVGDDLLDPRQRRRVAREGDLKFADRLRASFNFNGHTG